MQQWINFYTNIDENTHHSLTKTFFFGLIPFIISIFITNSGYVGWGVVTYSSTWSYLFAGFINHLIVIAGGFGALIVIGLAYITGEAIFKWFKNTFIGIGKFINVVKTAKQEEFDSSAVDMKPEKNNFTVKE